MTWSLIFRHCFYCLLWKRALTYIAGYSSLCSPGFNSINHRPSKCWDYMPSYMTLFFFGFLFWGYLFLISMCLFICFGNKLFPCALTKNILGTKCYRPELYTRKLKIQFAWPLTFCHIIDENPKPKFCYWTSNQDSRRHKGRVMSPLLFLVWIRGGFNGSTWCKHNAAIP